ncbi:MAG TPA: response regulator [Chitinophagaceae bacterium]|jgi:DNA-binding NarL/FixJ family response regulator
MHKAKKQILIIDDSALIVERLINMLTDMENIGSVRLAGTCAEASILLEQSQFQIIFLDIHLPDKSGIELLNKIKTNHPEIIVVMFTNQGGDFYKTLCMQLGANYFIDKSKDFELIPEIISSINN